MKGFLKLLAVAAVSAGCLTAVAAKPNRERLLADAARMLNEANAPKMAPSVRADRWANVMRRVYAKLEDEGREKARQLYTEARKRTDLAPADIVRLTVALAEVEFANSDIAAGDAIIDGLADIAGANEADVLFARGDWAVCKYEIGRAIDCYERGCRAALPDDWSRWTAQQKLAELYVRDNRVNDAIALYRRLLADEGFKLKDKILVITEKLVPALIDAGDIEGAEKALADLRAVADAEKKPERLRKNVLALDLTVALARRDLVRAKRTAVELDNQKRLAEVAMRLFADGKWSDAADLYAIHLPTLTSDWRAWNPTWRQPTASADIVCEAAVAFWRAGRHAEFAKILGETLQAAPKVSAGRKLACRIAGEFFGKDALSSADLDRLLAGAEPGVARDALTYAARVLIVIGRYDEPKLLSDRRDGLIVRHERNSAAVRYVAGAPTDAGSWLSSGLMTPENRHVCDSRIDRAAADRLVLEVSVDRGAKAADGAEGNDACCWFYVCYDEQGVHLLIEQKDPQIGDVLRGKTAAAGYEAYLAIGEGAPVYQFGFSPASDAFEFCPPWNSPHKFFRPAEDYVKFTSRPTEGGFVTAFNISWELAYHALPEEGATWPFEVIYWSRGGGVTWGGTDLWQLSNWGRWRFEGMSDAVKAKIRRILMYKALARFKAEKEIYRGGAIGTWKDEELGDPEFYEKSLRPFVERLDALAAEAEGEPDDETVNRLFREAVPQWYDFRYFAAELREKYLSEKYLEP